MLRYHEVVIAHGARNVGDVVVRDSCVSKICYSLEPITKKYARYLLRKKGYRGVGATDYLDQLMSDAKLRRDTV